MLLGFAEIEVVAKTTWANFIKVEEWKLVLWVLDFNEERGSD